MLLAAFIRVFSSQYFPQDFFQLGTFSSIGFMGTLSIAALWQLAYAPYVSDYSRYLPKATGAKTAFWASYWGCSLGSLISMILGLTVARAYSGDFIQGLIHLTGSGLFSTRFDYRLFSRDCCHKLDEFVLWYFIEHHYSTNDFSPLVTASACQNHSGIKLI